MIIIIYVSDYWIGKKYCFWIIYIFQGLDVTETEHTCSEMVCFLQGHWCLWDIIDRKEHMVKAAAQ